MKKITPKGNKILCCSTITEQDYLILCALQLYEPGRTTRECFRLSTDTRWMQLSRIFSEVLPCSAQSHISITLELLANSIQATQVCIMVLNSQTFTENILSKIFHQTTVLQFIFLDAGMFGNLTTSDRLQYSERLSNSCLKNAPRAQLHSICRITIEDGKRPPPAPSCNLFLKHIFFLEHPSAFMCLLQTIGHGWPLT